MMNSYKQDPNRPTGLSTSSLEGTKVYNFNNEHIGEIKDYVVDLDNGNVMYGVLSFGGFMGIGDKYFAVPWNAMTIDTENKCIRFDATTESLENAPGFDKNHWPSTGDHAFTDEVYEYYGYEPYSTWRERTFADYRVRELETV